MSTPTIIKTPGGEELVVIPRAEYEALVSAADSAAEDAADIAIFDARMADLSKQDQLPAQVSLAILRGDRRVKAIRKWRGMKQIELARKVGVTQGALSDIESGRRSPSSGLATQIAAALNVDPSWVE